LQNKVTKNSNNTKFTEYQKEPQTTLEFCTTEVKATNYKIFHVLM